MITDTAVKNIQATTIEKAAFFLAMKTWLWKHNFKLHGNLRFEQFKGEDGTDKAFWRVSVRDFEFCESKAVREARRQKMKSEPNQTATADIPF